MPRRIERHQNRARPRAAGAAFGRQPLERVAREFAPYLGINWTRSFGRAARFARIDGDDPSRTGLVIGVRAWF